MCIEKQVLEKMFTNRQNIGFATMIQGQKRSPWLSGKEKVSSTAIYKEDDANNVLGHERNYHYWFPWKRCNYKQGFLLPT